MTLCKIDPMKFELVSTRHNVSDGILFFVLFSIAYELLKFQP